DAECERGDDGEREGGAAPEGSNRIAQIARDGLDERRAARIAARLFHLFDAAEFEPRAAQRRLVRHAVPFVVLRLSLDVEAELRVELMLEGVARKERAQAIAKVG